MRKNTLRFLILFTVITATILVCKDDMLLALPDIAHKDITPMSTKIKRELRELEESRTNGLRDALGGERKEKIEEFDGKVSTSNVSEDYPPNSGYGAQHYFDPTTGMGMWGIFTSAKSRASDLYNNAMKVRCFSVPLGIANATRPWEIFVQAMHLMQDMTTPAHTIMLDHALGDSFEKYVEKNWKNWDPGTPDEVL